MYSLTNKCVFVAGHRGMVGGALIFAFLFGAGELSLRLMGAGNFPLFEASQDFGYIPKPSQSGSFMGKDFAFNSKSMGIGKEFAGGGILLIGDSIVYGGNLYKQSEKLAYVLEKKLNIPVWPISAGSWGLWNELRYLELNPEVVQSVDQVVFVLNSGDFDTASIWRSDLTHPRKEPVSVLFFWIEKKIFSFIPFKNIDEEKNLPNISISSASLKDLWFRVISQLRTPPIIVLYPNQDEMNDPIQLKKFFDSASSITKGGILIDLSKSWKNHYFTDTIHPSPSQGVPALADVIKDALKENAQ